MAETEFLIAKPMGDEYPLDKNPYYSYLQNIKEKLCHAKNQMEPLIQKYETPDGNIFKKVTSECGSFRHTRKVILDHRNAQLVTFAWMKIYEILSRFKLIPEDSDDPFVYFDNCSFPGSAILAVIHYVGTISEPLMQKDLFTWFASSLLSDVTQDKENPYAPLGDQYKLYEMYPENWLMKPDEDLKGDILDLNYIEYIGGSLGNQVDLYTSEYGIDVSGNKMYNKQEEVHAKGELAQIICGFKTLRNGGNLICKIFTFFNPFTISLIGLTAECFEELYIYKPKSSKPDNSEVFMIGKKFIYENGMDVLPAMMEFMTGDNFVDETLIDLNNTNQDFWISIKKAAVGIFEELQISRIENNILTFEQLIKKSGDPLLNYEFESKLKRLARETFHDRIEKENTQWFETYPVYSLHKNYRLSKIPDPTPKTYPKQFFKDEQKRPFKKDYKKKDSDGFQEVRNKRKSKGLDFSVFRKNK